MIICDNLHLKNAQYAAGTNYSLSFRVHVKSRLDCSIASELGRRGGRAFGGRLYGMRRAPKADSRGGHSNQRAKFPNIF